MSKSDYAREFAIETAKLAFTEDVVKLMERRKISRAELAKRLGCSAANVTQILRHKNNLTFSTAVEIAQALGAWFNPRLRRMW